MSTPLAVRISRLLAEFEAIEAEHLSYRASAIRGSSDARNSRERLHREWDEKYDLLRWLQLQAAMESLDTDEACEGA